MGALDSAPFSIQVKRKPDSLWSHHTGNIQSATVAVFCAEKWLEYTRPSFAVRVVDRNQLQVFHARRHVLPEDEAASALDDRDSVRRRASEGKGG